MVAIRTKFDGKTIEVPAELKDGAAGEVIVVVADSMVNCQSIPPRSSIWDVINKASGSRTLEDINRQIAEERDAWDGR
jgi:hypothetical protein